MRLARNLARKRSGKNQKKSGVCERRSSDYCDWFEANLLGRSAGRSFAGFASLGFLLGFKILAGLLIDHLH